MRAQVIDGKPWLLTSGDKIKPVAAQIDIGINRVETPDGARQAGGADFDSCTEAAGWITSVLDGVGPVTLSAPMQNAVMATRTQMDHYRASDVTATQAAQ